ncbi:hypothetical protein BDE18_2935 [Paracoccus pantotrophus]|uniref:Uncharacterized protein n=1 Tax=Paracoccus pantotrophus TaxID=82367 RepID=A0ABX9S899_PARPN|nr:hypothetical protein [Paracoccus pantotrophus]RKS44103.1 hypothetical protein BDE18_2935 [Paracoccus pantotrophus]
MRDDLNLSEKRLIAALDRIDQFLDRAAARQAPQPVPADADAALQLHELQAENRRLSQELAALHARQSDTLSTCEQRLAEAHRRLVEAGEEAARLSAANEALTEANRALIAARQGDGAPDEARRALEAEIESLRAARAAEVAQMGEIVDALDRMIEAPASDAGVSGDTPAPGPTGMAEHADAGLDGERG